VGAAVVVVANAVVVGARVDDVAAAVVVVTATMVDEATVVVELSGEGFDELQAVAPRTTATVAPIIAKRIGVILVLPLFGVLTVWIRARPLPEG
jgi:hypothetical protein